MRKIVVFFLFICMSLLIAGAQSTNEVCRLGIRYVAGENPHWGEGRLIVTHVQPYSSAEQAGVKRFDIIEKIDGIPVSTLSSEQIRQMLNPSDKFRIRLTLRNFGYMAKDVLVAKECLPKNTITEEQLAEAFGMYSLENTTERVFTCPFTITSTLDRVDFINYRSFSFYDIEGDNAELEMTINSFIRQNLQGKGLVYNSLNPDLLIQTYYYFDTNPDYHASEEAHTDRKPVYRFDTSLLKMVPLPFLSNQLKGNAEYLLQFGVRFVDRQSGVTVWEAEANEWMYEPFDLAEYAQVHVPLMCLQYPHVSQTKDVTFKVGFKTYNYTGLNYDITALGLVRQVDAYSSAYEAGIREGDMIESIEGKDMTRSADEYTMAYKRFIIQSMQYRDSETLYTDANGFARCMFWRTDSYPRVQELLTSSEYLPVFSYLYKFAPYVDTSADNSLKMRVSRSGEAFETTVRPVIRTSLTIDIQ